MNTRPAAPDPQRDQHVAFPDDPAASPAPGLPPTAWAPARGGGLLRPPPPASSYRPHRSRRGHAAWWVVGAFFVLPMLGSGMWSNGVTSDGMMGGMPVEWHEPAEPWLNGSTIVVKELSGEAVSGVQPDGPTYAVPPGTTTYRVEVAGGDSRGSLQIIGAQGDTSVPETAMPFAVEVEMGEPGALQWVMAQGAYGQREIQCRVYVGEDLVAISTGQGTTECALPQP